MSSGTVFYILGGSLAGLAVLTSLLGLRSRRFPGSTALMVGILAVFAALVIGTTTIGVRHSKHEQEARAAEIEEEEAAEAQGNAAGSTGAPEPESGQKEAGAPESGQKEAGAPESGQKEAGAPESGQKEAGEPEGGAKKGGGGPKKKAGAAAGGPGGTLKLAADPTQIAFDTKQLTSKPGKVTIDFENPAPLEHDVAIEQGGKVIAVSQRISEGKTSVSANLAPGTYTFLCTVPGHAEAGMEGTLTVK
jgi:plastocyanin